MTELYGSAENGAVCLALLQRAKDGDNAAAKILLQHTLGKPTAPVDPDRIEIDECRLRAESAIRTPQTGFAVTKRQ